MHFLDVCLASFVATCFWDSFMLLHVPILHSQLCIIPLYKQTTVDRHLDCFHFMVITSKATTNILMLNLMMHVCTNFVMYIPRSEIAGLQGIYSAFIDVASFPRCLYQSTLTSHDALHHCWHLILISNWPSTTYWKDHLLFFFKYIHTHLFFLNHLKVKLQAWSPFIHKYFIVYFLI